ncbi:hypothetical protein KR222_002059 [Zaprionus bogoriensis]|nr:hypothetical protein KR222_002059 [Zaprionus bogoriensis]
MQLLISLLILSGLSHRLQCIQLADLPQQLQAPHQAALLQLVLRIHLERHFDTLVLYGSAACPFEALLQQLELQMELPVVLLAEGSSSSNSDWRFNNEALLLCCGADAEQERNEQTLHKLQQARRLVYLEEQLQPGQLCAQYAAREQHNVLMLHAATGNIYACRYFHRPQQYVQLQSELEKEEEEEEQALYVEQFANMQGAVIRTEADQLAPRSMFYRDARTGELRMRGYVASLMNAFVQRVNATLKMPENPVLGHITYYGIIEERAKQGELDVGIALASTVSRHNLDHLSYPYMISSYCFMVPEPAPLPYKQLYTLIVDPLVLWLLALLFLLFSLLLIYSSELSWRRLSLLNLLLNDRCLRGLLAQSFPLPAQPSRHLKAICFLLCFASIMTTSMYECYLQSFFTHPPPEPLLRSFEDVRHSRFRIAIDRNEAELLMQSYNLSLMDLHNMQMMDDWNKFVHMRDTFNASFIYPVTRLRWRTYSEQQKIFARPAFYYSDDICMQRFVLLCVPMRPQLPYRGLFERHMMLLQQFGLVQFWIGRSFYEMVRLRHTPLVDYSEKRVVEEQLYVRDISWILQSYLLAHLCAAFCFAIECCWSRMLRRRKAAVRLLKC